MDSYRLYFLSPDGQHIDNFTVIEAPDVFGAIETARLYQGRYALELWLLGEKIEAFPTVRSAPAQLVERIEDDYAERRVPPGRPEYSRLPPSSLFAKTRSDELQAARLPPCKR